MLLPSCVCLAIIPTFVASLHIIQHYTTLHILFYGVLGADSDFYNWGEGEYCKLKIKYLPNILCVRVQGRIGSFFAMEKLLKGPAKKKKKNNLEIQSLRSQLYINRIYHQNK